MDAQEVVRRRLAANGLASPVDATPPQVVASLLAVQSQDVQPSAWSVAQRLVPADGTEAAVERARAEGRLVRTHVLRTTWHDVRREDLRWQLALTAPRVLQLAAAARRELGLADELVAPARRAVEPAVTGRAQTRAQLAQVLADAGLVLDARGLGWVLMLLELHAVVCSGPRERHLHTYALLDERVPPSPAPDDPTAELVRRFLRGHGPATVKDLSWWSSLRVSDLRRALTALGDELRRDEVDGLELWSCADAPAPPPAPGLQLVQVYDEHLVAFTESKRLTDPGRAVGRRERPYLGVVLDDGVVAGSWGRTVHAASVTVRVTPLDGPLDPAGLDAAARASGAFLALPATLELQA